MQHESWHDFSCGGSLSVSACVNTVIVVCCDVVIMQLPHVVLHFASALTEGTIMT